MRFLGFTFKQVGFWGIAVLVFAAHQLAERYLDIHQSAIDNYVDAFLFPVIVIPIILADTRLRLKDHSYKFPVVVVLGIMVALIVFSEVVFPYLSERFIGDVTDVMMIIAGSMVYYLFFNMQGNKIRQ